MNIRVERTNRSDAETKRINMETTSVGSAGDEVN